MKTLGIVALSIVLTGCVVTPHRGGVGVSVPVPAPVVVYPQYPQYESAYVWDPAMSAYFFFHESRRMYMPRGWHHKQHGIPRGQYNRGNDNTHFDHDRDGRDRRKH